MSDMSLAHWHAEFPLTQAKSSGSVLDVWVAISNIRMNISESTFKLSVLYYHRPRPCSKISSEVWILKLDSNNFVFVFTISLFRQFSIMELNQTVWFKLCTLWQIERLHFQLSNQNMNWSIYLLECVWRINSPNGLDYFSSGIRWTSLLKT